MKSRLPERAARLQLADGLHLAYRITEQSAVARRPVLVLIHGLASNLTRWSEFVETSSLGEHYDLIRVDLRGHGDSSPRAALRNEIWCDDIAAILDHERYARACIIGHSLGAQVALHFAARYRARTLGLVLIDPVFPQALHGKWKRVERFRPALRIATAFVRVANMLGLHRRAIEPLDLAELDRSARLALRSKDSEAEFMRRYSSTRADLAHVSTSTYLQDLVEMFLPVPAPRDISVPVLVLLSSGATFADVDQMAALVAAFPHGQTRIIECQHWPLTERPAEVRAAIEEWCALHVENDDG